MEDHKQEELIQAAGLTAPRVTLDQIDAIMQTTRTWHVVVPGTTTTLAAVILPNGFTLAVGKSACASPANFNEEIGARFAIDDAMKKARDKLWELEGYVLSKSLAAATQ